MHKKLQEATNVLLFSIAVFVGLSSCHKKVTLFQCSHHSDCRLAPETEPKNSVCHKGKCEECVENSDCGNAKLCINYRCESSCRADSECGLNMHCEDNRCLENCGNGVPCIDNRVCSNTRCIAQTKVNPFAYGWAGIACTELLNIYFDRDSHEISPYGRERVQRLVNCLHANPELQVVLEGHADERGSTSYNMALSERRISSIKTSLESEGGVSSNRIKTVAYGEKKPAVRDKTKEAWRLNRRVEFKLEQMLPKA